MLGLIVDIPLLSFPQCQIVNVKVCDSALVYVLEESARGSIK